MEGNYLVISARDTFAAKERLQGLAFLRTKGSHTSPLQHQGQHRLHGVITWRSHFCLLVLIPSLKKIHIVYMGKKLTFGCMPLDVQPKKRHSCSAPLAFNHNIAQAHGRSQSKFPQRQTIMGHCSQKSHKFCKGATLTALLSAGARGGNGSCVTPQWFQKRSLSPDVSALQKVSQIH